MIFIAASAALVGFVHSLAPGHWLPVVLVARSKRWPLRTAILGALVAGSGHVLFSNLLGAVSLWVGAHLLGVQEELVERYTSAVLMAFGLGYSLWAYFNHSHCVGHTHHGPDHRKKKIAPFAFLFSLGLSPCVAVLPVFGAASAKGVMAVVISMVAFSGGVLTSLVGSTVLALHGLAKLDHPIFEHYGDVITGGSIFLMGLILFFFPI